MSWRSGTKGRLKARRPCAYGRRSSPADMGQGAAASSRGRGLADRRAPRVGREEILSRQLGRRNGPPQLSRDDQGTMDLRAGPSTVEGGTRSRPLRGKVLARPSSSCADGDDRLRVPPTSPAQKSEAGKKESTARPLNRRCRRSATPSSTSSCDQVLSDVRTADPGSARKSSVSKSAKVVLEPKLIRPIAIRDHAHTKMYAEGIVADYTGAATKNCAPV